MTTIIFAHPKHDGMNGRIYHAILQQYEETGTDYTAIDLYKDKFSPLLTADELDGFYNGIATDPQVKRYQEVLMKTDKLILVFPIWFNEYPAIFKGFFDRVFQGKFAFEYVPGGVLPKLTHIKQALVVTTSHAPTEVLRDVQGDMIQRQVIGHMLKTTGVADSKWLNLGGIQSTNEEQLMDFISILKKEIRSF